MMNGEITGTGQLDDSEVVCCRLVKTWIKRGKEVSGVRIIRSKVFKEKTVRRKMLQLFKL